ncbi:MAG: Molybdate/tungstate transport system permease protein WtpB [Candidatus Heimdallarchaeota archaeon LC_2]|nr:MAG: Molybdate/tungstate transport system permease protein WtpB [Candidatus Heimdallarchaeota archaeon LC_2]
MVIMSAFRNDDGSFNFVFWDRTFSSTLFIEDPGRLFNKYILNPKVAWNEWFSKDEVLGETWYIIEGVDHGIILNSIIIAVFTTIISLIIGISLALFMAKRDFRGKQLVSMLILIPLIIPPFVGGMGFWQMFGQTGLINTEILMPYFGVRFIIKGLAAIIFVEAFHYYTLVYLNVYSSLSNIDPSLEEQAKNMGAKGFTLMRTVTLPLAMPGIAAGGILTFILAIEDLGTPIVFAARGDNQAKKTMTYYIFSNLTNTNPNSVNIVPPITAVISSILLFIAILGFIFIRKYVSMRSYSMLGKGRAGKVSRPRPSRLEYFIFYPTFLIIFLLSVISHIGVLYLAFNTTTTFPPDWGSENFDYVFSSTHDVVPFIINTIQYSLISLVVVLIFGTMAAYAISRVEFKGKALFDTLITIPIAIPGVVVGLGYIVLFSDSFNYNVMAWFGVESDFRFTFDPFIYPVLLLIASYAVRKFPFAVRSIFAGLQQTSVALEEASYNLGASRSKTIKSITLPLISLNIAAGGLIALVYTLAEVSTTLIIVFQAKYGTITWTMGTQQTSRLGVFAALGVLLMAVQIISLVISNLLLKNRTEAMTGI